MRNTPIFLYYVFHFLSSGSKFREILRPEVVVLVVEEIRQYY